MSLEIFKAADEPVPTTADELREELLRCALKAAELSTMHRRECGRVVCLVKCLRKLTSILAAQPPSSLTYFAGLELHTAVREAVEVFKLCEGIE